MANSRNHPNAALIPDDSFADIWYASYLKPRNEVQCTGTLSDHVLQKANGGEFGELSGQLSKHIKRGANNVIGRDAVMLDSRRTVCTNVAA
jgi:hypothetical protein